MRFGKWFLVFFVTQFVWVNLSFSQDFEVSPTRLEFTAEPGENQTKVLHVRNHGNKKLSYVISIMDFIPGSDGQKNSAPPGTTRGTAANWLNINPSFFELSPGEQIPVQVTMLVPMEEYGAAWATLYVAPTVEQTSWDADKSLAAGVMVSSRISVSVYQSPESNKNHMLNVSGIKEITEADDVNRKFSAAVENLGDKVTEGKVFLIASNIDTGEEVDFPVIKVETYPRMTRNVELELPKGKLPPGKYALAVIVDYGPRFNLEGAQIIIDVE